MVPVPLRRSVLLLAASVFAFSGCGGGGGGASAPPAIPAGVSTQSPVLPPGSSSAPSATPTATALAGATASPVTAPTATATPVAAPTATVTPTPRLTATATPPPVSTPTAAPAPTLPAATAPPAAAPGVAYLAVNGTSATGTIAATSSSGTIVATSAALFAGGLPATASITLAAGANASSPLSFARAAQTVALGTVLGRATPGSSTIVPPSLHEPQLPDERILASARNRMVRMQRPLAYRRAKSLPSALGSTGSLYVFNAPIGTSQGQYVPIASTLAAITPHAYVWVDNAAGVSAQTASAIGNDFENAYTSDRLHFGTNDYPSTAPGMQFGGAPCDATGSPIAGAAVQPEFIPESDPHTIVFVVAQNSAGAGEGGYFSTVNHMTQGVLNCISPGAKSNEAPTIVLVWPAVANVSYEINEDAVRGTAHEFQHLINFVNHTLLSPSPTSELTFINEGLSMLAQDFAVNALYPGTPLDVNNALFYGAKFLARPSSYSLEAFSGVDSGSSLSFNCGGCYGGAYLFERYLYERFGGDAYTRAMESAQTSGGASLQNATGQNYAQLFGDFSIALATSGLGYNSDSRFNFVNFNPYGTYTDQFGGRLRLSGPGTTVVAPGSSAIVSTYVGSLVYGTVQPAPGAGASVKVTDGIGSFSLEAGLVQR